MMVGWVAYVWERPGTAEELAKVPFDDPDLLFDRFDRNGDDVITPDEIPEQMKTFLKLAGVKIPDKVTRAEFPALMAEMLKKFEKPKKKDQ
jgi:hypothetical protein